MLPFVAGMTVTFLSSNSGRLFAFAVDATMHEPVTQAELDEFAERLGYASCSDDDDESIQKKRLRQSPARRQRERAKRRSLRHERNLDPDNNSAPLALPGELDDPASTRLRRMYQAAGIPLRGGIDVRPVFDKHIETIEGEPYIKAGSHFIVSTLRDGSMTTEGAKRATILPGHPCLRLRAQPRSSENPTVTSPGTLKEREECVLHVNECRRLRRAFLRLLLGPKAVDPKGRASVGLGIALNARGVRCAPWNISPLPRCFPPRGSNVSFLCCRFLPDVATLEPPAWAKPPASRIRVDLSPDSFYFAPDVQNSRWQMLLGAVGQHFT